MVVYIQVNPLEAQRAFCKTLDISMKKGTGFVYPSSGGPSRSSAQLPKRGSAVERAKLHFERVLSPRKRKRSPEPSTFQEKKQPKPAEQFLDDEEEFDQLGTAALEEYELTQRPKEVVASSHTASVVGSSRGSPAAVLGPLTATVQQQQPYSLPAGGASAEADDRVKELSEKLQEMEEKGYERDGEVKLLRTELRKKEEQLREMHVRLVSEHKQKEEEYSQKAKSLSTQLEFKEQELVALRERCSSLEQRQKNQLSLVHTSPIPHSRPPKRPMGQSEEKNRDFLSTKTFMPLSQMSQVDVTPVHISTVSKRGPAIPEATRVTPQQSSSVTGLSLSLAGVVNHEPDTRAVVSSELELRLPPQEMSSRELLTLLAQPELLKIPKFRSESDEDSTETESDSNSPLEPENVSLPGLFSLLHIPQSSSSSAHSMPLFSSNVGLVTPLSKLQETTTPTSGGSSLAKELSYDSTTPATPTRKSRLQLHRQPPHTCARTDMFRTRVVREDFPLRKAQSASNTPTHDSSADPLLPEREPEGISQTLLDSLNVESLTESVRSMLTDSTFSVLSQGMSSSHTTTPLISEPPSLSPSMAPPDCGVRDEDTPNVEVQLLDHLGDVVIRYVAEQMEQAQAFAAASNHSDHESVSEGSQSPMSSISSNTASSTRNSSDLNQPSKADQSFLHHSLCVLETLLKYSRRARDKLTASPPPKYSLEDEVAPTRLETELARGEGVMSEDVEVMEEGGGDDKMGSFGVTASHNFPGTKPRTVVWKGQVLEQMVPAGELSRVWVPRREETPSAAKSSRNWRQRSASAPLSVTPYGRGMKEDGERLRKRQRNGGVSLKGGQILSSLLRLVSPRWRESNEVILLGLKLLFIVAQECSSEELERFASLLDRDGLDSYLAEEKPDPSLCLESLKLLTCLSHSPQLASLLCSKGDTSEGCLLQLCYEFFTKGVTDNASLQNLIHVQLLLTSITNLIQKLIQDACSAEDISRQNVLLLCSLVALLNRVFLIDPYFDTHKDACNYTFTYSIQTLKFLFENCGEVNSTTKYILSELYAEFCEDDIAEASEGSGEDEESQMVT